MYPRSKDRGHWPRLTLVDTTRHTIEYIKRNCNEECAGDFSSEQINSALSDIIIAKCPSKHTKDKKWASACFAKNSNTEHSCLNFVIGIDCECKSHDDEINIPVLLDNSINNRGTGTLMLLLSLNHTLSCWIEAVYFKMMNHIVPDAFDGGLCYNMAKLFHIRFRLFSYQTKPEKMCMYGKLAEQYYCNSIETFLN